MKVETLSFQEILKRVPDIFEAVVVAGQRAGQINGRRAAERVDYEIDEYEEDYPMMDDIDEDYEELDKAITLAMGDFMDDRLTWRYATPDEGEATTTES